jgi:hypothetical protein
MSKETCDEEVDLTYEEFLLVHQNQLENSCVPQLYWAALFRKLKNEVTKLPPVICKPSQQRRHEIPKYTQIHPNIPKYTQILPKYTQI